MPQYNNQRKHAGFLHHTDGIAAMTDPWDKRKDKRKPLPSPGLREITSQPRDEAADVSFKYFQRTHQCLSVWASAELKALSKFFTKMAGMTWPAIMQDTGLRFTPHKDRNRLPGKGKFLDQYEEVKKSFELRVEDDARVHGFRRGNTFYLVWLDKNHEVYPDK